MLLCGQILCPSLVLNAIDLMSSVTEVDTGLAYSTLRQLQKEFLAWEPFLVVVGQVPKYSLSDREGYEHPRVDTRM